MTKSSEHFHSNSMNILLTVLVVFDLMLSTSLPRRFFFIQFSGNFSVNTYTKFTIDDTYVFSIYKTKMCDLKTVKPDWDLQQFYV